MLDARVRTMLAAGVLVALGVAVAGGGDVTTQGARRDADGRFLNSAGDLPFASPVVTLPFFARRVGSMLTGRSGYPETVANDGALLRANAGDGAPNVTWIGHATVLVQMDGATFLTDPSGRRFSSERTTSTSSISESRPSSWKS